LIHAKMMCYVSVVRIGKVFKQNVCIRIACKHVSKCFQTPTASPGISEMNQTYMYSGGVGTHCRFHSSTLHMDETVSTCFVYV